MTPELWLLACSAILGIVQIIISSHSASLQRGYQWAASSRDGSTPPLTGVAGRLERCFRNFLETFPLFAAMVFIAHLTNKHNWMTVWGAHLYFWARLLYIPLYAFGVPLIRSLVWNVATLGIVLIFVSLF